jgi:general secretion pathway protein G
LYNACGMVGFCLNEPCPNRDRGTVSMALQEFSQIARGYAAVPTSNSSRWRDARGFTLLELLVVIAIIGLLAGYVGPRYFSQIGKSEVGVAKAQIDSFEKALDQYRLDTGHYPNTDQGLAALNAKPATEPKWQGPYLRKAIPLDPWGNPYIYKLPGDHGEYDLLSYGKDGIAGGAGEAADITNW